MQYCLVVNGNIGAPAALPRDYRNISNFYALPPADLARYNWYPFNPATKPTINEQTQKAVETLTFDAQQGKVNQSWQVVTLTAEERTNYLRSIRPQFQDLLESHMNREVSYRDYASVDTAIGRWTNSRKPAWKAEAVAVQSFIEDCYDVAYAIENEVKAGTRPIPTPEQFLAALPRLGWAPPAPPNGNGTISGNGTSGGGGSGNGPLR
jgi:hypothetical protein